MNIRQSICFTALALSASALPLLVQAAGDHQHSHGASAQQGAPAAADFTEGEIRKVNKSTGKLTIKHGEIKNIQMPPMTMVFEVADKAMLDSVKEGDKIKFKARQDGSKLTVTEIQR
ncbi:copper-binding protein [Limnobacter humi]|uniref:Copper-binding protein n=1 Tax=Limnobacter humi TaxID=1778671 RepID=A0ABT1WDA1_9BURK|nr:copper-binding protein [Limnobacter humi]MCQ8895503.1 copper-binding protein [Limnobacter humi]